MTEKHFTYEVEGTAAGGQTWKTAGAVVGDDLTLMFHMAMRDSFNQLTQGKAVFGKPGVGCNGPYKISKVTMESVRVRPTPAP